MKSKFLVLSATLMLALAGCNAAGGDDFTPSEPGGDTPVEPGGDTPTTVSVESVSLDSATWALEVGESHTLTATVLPENATNKAVTWSATDTTVVSVNNGVVTALKAGSSVVTVTTVDGSKTASCTFTVSEADPGDDKPEGAVDLEYAETKDIASHGDNYCYFNDPNSYSGATAAINAAYIYEGDIVFDYTYADRDPAAPAPQEWSVQLFRKNTSLKANTNYTLSFKLTSDKAGTIKVNTQAVSIVEGENNVSVKYSEGHIAGAENVSFMVLCPWATIGSAKLVFEDINWEEEFAGPQGVVVNQSGDDYIVAFAAVADATGYKAYYVDADGNDVNNEVVTNGGKLTKVSELADGKYKVYVTAFKGEKESLRSTTFGVITIGTPEDVVPAGGPKTNMEFGEEHTAGVLALPDDKFVYWNDQGWCGSVIGVTEAYTEEGTVNCSYTHNAADDFIPEWASSYQTVPGCDYCFQVFYKNTSLTAGSAYTLSITLNSTSAGQVKFNNKPFDITASTDTTLSVDYTEVANDASFALVFPSTMGSNTIVISNISWTAK